MAFRQDSRLPITLPILDKLISVSPRLQGSYYQISQFRAVCSLAFYAFLRSGEITSLSKRDSTPPIRFYQITKLINQAGDFVGFKVTFGDFKHNYNSRPFFIDFRRQPHSCPVDFLANYLALEGSSSGPLFMTVDGLPISRANSSQLFPVAIQLCGLAPSRYKFHSFRIGAASFAADQGFSDTQIRLLGR